jgi:hypothetical protein
MPCAKRELPAGILSVALLLRNGMTFTVFRAAVRASPALEMAE